MDFPSLLLLILLPTADAATETTAAVQATLYEDLGQVPIAVAPDTPSARNPRKNEKEGYRTRFVAHLEWNNAHQAIIALWEGKVFGQKGKEIGIREVTFKPQDSDAERGRSIGLVIVQLLHELPPALLDLGPSPPVTVPKSEPTHAVSAALWTEKATGGVWALGPSLTLSMALAPWLQIHITGMLSEGHLDGYDRAKYVRISYSNVGYTLGAAWLFYRAADNARTMGIGADLGVVNEGVEIDPGTVVGAEHVELEGRTGTAKKWTYAISPSLRGSLKLWKSLRFLGAIGIRWQNDKIQASATQKIEYPEVNGVKTKPDEATAFQVSISKLSPWISLGVGFAF